MPEDHIKGNPGGGPTTPPSTQVEGPREAVEFGAAVPATDVDTTGSRFGPDPSLPIYELPHATGPGSNDPFGIKPIALAVGYEQPLSLLGQFLSGEQSGGRNTFMLPYEPGFFRDLGIAIASDLEIVTLRLRFTEFQPPSPREAALGRIAAAAIPAIAGALIPGAADDLALAAATAGKAAARGAVGGTRPLGDLTAIEISQIQSVVDAAGRPLEVVGSAASGTRRAVGSGLPIGKGPGTRSDIDFLAPPSSHPYYKGLEGRLPSLDPGTGLIPGVHNPHIGPAIRFEPGAAPYLVPGAP